MDESLQFLYNANCLYRWAHLMQNILEVMGMDAGNMLRGAPLQTGSKEGNAAQGSRPGYAPGVQEHILVCLSPAPANGKIVQAAARMAAAFQGRFTALFVETPAYPEMGEEENGQLRANKRLAEELGAAIQIVYGEDVAYQIAEYAHVSGVSKIVVGRSSTKRRTLFGKPSLTERLADIAPALELHIIPDTASNGFYKWEKQARRPSPSLSLQDGLVSIMILVLSTLIGFVFLSLGFTDANVITIYILGVLIISVVTQARIYSLVASVVSVLVFNFYFTAPRFTFVADDRGYMVTFAVMLLAALLTGSLAVKLKTQAKRAAQAAFRTNVLFDTNRLLQKAHSDDEIMAVTADQLIKLMDRDMVVYPVQGGDLGEAHIFPVTDKSGALTTDSERAAAVWALKNNDCTGAATDAPPEAACLYLTIRKDDMVYGVVGIRVGDQPLDSFENNVLLSILGECALALENSRNNREKEEAAVLAQNEQLRANLLRTISHDLRTPLTSISGNASNLLSNSAGFDEETKTRIYRDIYDDAMWLVGLVENLLAITRIEQGGLGLRLSAELMDEVITEALHRLDRKCAGHHVTVGSSDELILAKMDARLMVQVMINLVDNAVKYTPAGSNISIYTETIPGFVAVSVADNGPGIPDEMKLQVFDMFFTGGDKVADSRRSLGLGLSLCRSIITAHGGEISVGDNPPHGTIVRFTLPAGEVELHE